METLGNLPWEWIGTAAFGCLSAIFGIAWRKWKKAFGELVEVMQVWRKVWEDDEMTAGERQEIIAQVNRFFDSVTDALGKK